MNFPTQITDNVDTATKTYVDINDRVLDTVVSVNRRIVDTATKTIADITDRVPAKSVDVPFADRMPTPTETGERYLDFVERAASVNRDFTARIIGQLPTGVAVAAKTQATKDAKSSAKASPKAAAPKRTAKRTAKSTK